MGMLEVILSDFSRLESETKTEESLAASVHDKFTAESAESKAVKEATVAHKRRDLRKTKSDIAEATTDFNNVSDQLAAANKYYDESKPSCVDSGLSYEERVQKREEEIESLKEALQILS